MKCPVQWAGPAGTVHTCLTTRRADFDDVDVDDDDDNGNKNRINNQRLGQRGRDAGVAWLALLVNLQ